MELLSVFMACGIVLLSTLGGIGGEIAEYESINLNEEIEEIDPVIGIWHSENVSLGDFLSADIYATIKKSGDVRIWGTMNSPILKFNDYHINLYCTWKHDEGNSYIASALDKNLKFYCDGNKLNVSGNPYKLGFINSKIFDSNFKLEFEKINIDKSHYFFDFIYT